jgi:hypothetical protein
MRPESHKLTWFGKQVWFLLAPYAVFTLAFGGSVVPKLNLYVDVISMLFASLYTRGNPSLVVSKAY